MISSRLRESLRAAVHHFRVALPGHVPFHRTVEDGRQLVYHAVAGIEPFRLEQVDELDAVLLAQVSLLDVLGSVLLSFGFGKSAVPFYSVIFQSHVKFRCV